MIISVDHFSHYRVAQESVKCYLKSTQYEVFYVDLFEDELVKNGCPHDQVF